MATELLTKPVESKDDIPESVISEDWYFAVPKEFQIFFRPVGAKAIRSRNYFAWKYTFDRVVGCILLVPASAIIALCCIAIKATSPGPALFWQMRVGLGGKMFKIVKLRTMRIDAESSGPVWSSGKSDPRVTWVGRILRRLHLDELPQLWNVAKGDMSLVGPRPERPEIIVDLQELIPAYHLRHNVKPGVTGLSQVNIEPDSNINFTRRKQVLDLRYIGKANFWIDIRTLAATTLRMVGIKGSTLMWLMGLRQDITDDELKAVDFEFGTDEDDLWRPGRPLPR